MTKCRRRSTYNREGIRNTRDEFGIRHSSKGTDWKRGHDLTNVENGVIGENDPKELFRGNQDDEDNEDIMGEKQCALEGRNERFGFESVRRDVFTDLETIGENDVTTHLQNIGVKNNIREGKLKTTGDPGKVDNENFL